MERIVTTGDDSLIPVQLYKDGAVFIIDSGATVKAALIKTDYSVKLTEPVQVLEATAGSDWANSLVVVQFASADTVNVSPGDALLEVEVDDGGKLTWQVSGIKVRKGLIT